MAVSGLSGIESMLSQMRAVVRTAQSGGVSAADLSPGAADATRAVSFADELARSIKRVSSAQMAATAQSKAFELGAPNVSLNDVMIDLQKSSLGFQTTVQVRNRLVAAYKEISSMSI
ncbi:flagellar hook-basal body complex protein FliE [Bordetella genomosp. 1]|uniref:Flagellar hook-basal body complex protein FliE n=1 Tax=Bordetella genomosp. 1 TaxID=1395607 RepID=A0A261SDB7_9BORD|nr:flagellar hook-basal body complex protein FliE [Bordetella genomosp. 1]OZI35145.1 flagellar hook-basal body complex protein FliE [Bordetella genomosp. 1]OZI63685.1 flagellar hook-basal body complex protein FliE [Bordetella genomosp. 1]